MAAQPKSIEDLSAELLWGNPVINDKHGKPTNFPSLAGGGFFTVGNLIETPLPAR